MTVFIVAYIQLTASQVGAKYLKRVLMVTINYYKKRIEELKIKIVAYAKMDNDAKVKELEKEVANYERHIRQNEPKGVDSYLS